MVVQLSILVGNVNDLIGLGYTRIEVHQSVDQGNSFQEVTAPAAAAAVLDSVPANTTFPMGGKTLKLSIDGGAEQAISFSSLLMNWTPTQVVNRINEVIVGLASVSGSKVRLTSPTTGRSSSVEATYTEIPELGFVAGNKVFGKSARPTLVMDTLSYAFPDVAGKDTDRYKWRFSANGSNPISDFSPTVSGQTAPVIPIGNLSIATARFFTADGQPVKTRLLIGIDSVPQSLAGVYITRDQPLVVDSGSDGFLQVSLVRGARVRIGIEGTAYVREFDVPNVPSFDLLTVMGTATDPFTIQTVPPLLTRRNI